MMLQELNERLTTAQVTNEQLWQINDLYILLDLHKDDFAKIVDAVGVEKLIEKQPHYTKAVKALDMLAAKEHYEAAKRRQKELEAELKRLDEDIAAYENSNDTF